MISVLTLVVYVVEIALVDVCTLRKVDKHAGRESVGNRMTRYVS